MLVLACCCSCTSMLLCCRDVLFCHRPDPDTPIEETVRAMNWVVNQVCIWVRGQAGVLTREAVCVEGVCGGEWGTGHKQ